MFKKSLESPRVAHSLYWLLAQALPGQTPQNSTVRYVKRYIYYVGMYNIIRYGPSMMSQGKTPWKDPRGGLRGV